MAKQKRDSAYYLGRIERDFPHVFAGYQAGKFGSVTEAAIAAGLKKPRTRLQELQNAWRRATSAERRAFEAWITPATMPVPAASVSASAVTVDRRLESWAILRIRYITATRNLKMGDVMDELGFKRLDPSLGNALNQGSRLRPAVIVAIESWLTTNASV